MRRVDSTDFASLLVALIIFLSLSLYQVDIPGLYYDEAADVVPAVQLLNGQKVELVNDAGIWLGDRAFPIMAMDYVGALSTYLVIPFFQLFGVSTFSVRLMTITASAAAIFATYFLVRGLFNRPIATIAILLLATHPSFVFWSRQGIHVTSIMGTVTVVSLLFLLRWHRGKGSSNLFMASFLLGTGLSAKLLFIWYILAFVFAYVIIFPKVVLKTLGFGRSPQMTSPTLSFASTPFARPTTANQKGNQLNSVSGISDRSPPYPSFGQIIISAFLLVLGSWTLLLYNLETQGTLAVLQKNAVTTAYGVNNFDFAANLVARWDAFLALLHGGHLWYLGGPFPNWIYSILFCVLVPIGLVLIFRSPYTAFLRPTVFIILVMVLVVLQSIVTVSGLGPTHYFALLPLVQIPIAVSIYLVYKRAGSALTAVPVALVVGGLMLGSNLYTDYLYHRSLTENGGLMTHSDAIYRLADYLDQRGVEKPIAMDWGIKTSVQVLTQGRINPVEIFQYEKEANDTFYDWLYGTLINMKTVYVFHTDDAAIFPRFAAFKSLTDRLDKKPVLEQTIAQRDGRPIFLIYSVK